MREYSLGTLVDIGETLSPEHVALLLRAGTPLTRRRGETIFRQGEPAEHVYFLARGQARSALIGRGGGESLLRLHLPHSLLGLTALGSHPVRDAEAVAASHAELLRIARGEFLGLLRDEPDLARRVIGLLVDRMRDFHHRVGDFLALPVDRRLASALLSLSRPDPAEGADARQPVRMTHQDLATLLNTRRPIGDRPAPALRVGRADRAGGPRRPGAGRSRSGGTDGRAGLSRRECQRDDRRAPRRTSSS